MFFCSSVCLVHSSKCLSVSICPPSIRLKEYDGPFEHHFASPSREVGAKVRHISLTAKKKTKNFDDYPHIPDGDSPV